MGSNIEFTEDLSTALADPIFEVDSFDLHEIHSFPFALGTRMWICKDDMVRGVEIYGTELVK
jgi:hypothetical protein